MKIFDCNCRMKRESSMKAKELLIRTNEWLLKELLADLHRSILSDMTKSSNRSSYIMRDQWERQVVKFWFLDSAATSISEYAASALGLDSELTVMATDGEDDDEISAFDDAPLDPGILMRKPAYPALNENTVHLLRRQYDEPPEGFSASSRSRAIQALENYVLEPAEPVKDW